MPESVGAILAALLPALLRIIMDAIRGNETARKRLVDIMPETSRSSLERTIDEAAVVEKFGSGR